MLTKANEDSLVRLCRGGDHEAFAQLLEHYERPIFNVAYRIIGNSEDARDITQGVFVKAFELLDRYDPAYRFYSWIYRIAINDSLNHVKKHARVEPLVEQPRTFVDPEQLAANGELSAAVQKGLMRLNSDHRTVIVLRHFAELSYRDMANVLDIAEKTVKSRLFTARQRLRDVLVEGGFRL